MLLKLSLFCVHNLIRIQKVDRFLFDRAESDLVDLRHLRYASFYMIFKRK